MQPSNYTFDLKNFKLARSIFSFDLILILLFSLVHFVPAYEALDPIGSQWLYLSLVDVVAVIYILIYWGRYKYLFSKIKNNKILLFYTLFAIWAIASYFYAFNNVETIVCLARLITTFVSTIVVVLFFLNNKELIYVTLLLLALTLVYDSFSILNNFITNANLGKTKLDELILSLRGLNGNKNVMAASFVIRLPLLIYFLYESNKYVIKITVAILLLIATTCIFILNTRSTFVTLFIFLFLHVVFIIYMHYRKILIALKELAFFILPIIIAFVLANNLITNANNAPINNGTNGYGTVTERIKTIQFTDEGSSARLRLWREAISYAKQHPIIGCGYGNWKLASIPFEKAFANEADVPYHSHNDFLEIATELGILGLLLFLGIFAFSAFAFIKALKAKKLDALFFIIILSLIGYMVDAMLNFPTERSTIQALFSFNIAIIIALFVYKFGTIIKEKKGVTIFVPIIIFVAVAYSSFINYKTYEWLKLQNKIFFDVMGKTEPKIPTDQIEEDFPDIPNLTYSTIPSNGILARYYIRDKRYNEALALIETTKNINPYIGYYGFLKTDCFFNMGKIDSAFYYAKQCYYERPRSISYYNNLVNIASDKRIADTAEIKKAFKSFTFYRNESAAWSTYLKCLINTNKVPSTEIKKILDSANLLFPKDSAFLSFKIVTTQNVDYDSLFKVAINKFSTKSYSEAIKVFKKLIVIRPNEYANYENLGLCYFSSNQFNEAIPYFDKAISISNNATGKSAFIKGVALLNLGKKKEACSSFQQAQQKNYPDAATNIKNNCTF